MHEQDVDFGRSLGLARPSARRLLATALVASAVAAALLPGTLWLDRRSQQESAVVDRLERGVAAMQRASRVLDEPAPGRGQLRRTSATTAASPPPSEVLAMLAGRDHPQTWLTRIEISERGQSLHLQGAASRETAVAPWLAGLLADGQWRLVRQQISPPRADGVLSFVVHLRLRSEP